MLRSFSLLILAFALVLGFLVEPSNAQEKLRIGYALPAYQGADADIAAYSYGYWVLEGLKFFEHEREDSSIKSKEAGSDRLEWKGVEIIVENVTSTNASAFADAYYSLVDVHQVDVVIGPISEAYTLAAIEGMNNASRVVPILALSATPDVLASSANLMTLIPPEDAYVMATEWLPAFQEFLGDRDLHLYSILALGPDPRAGNGSNSSSSVPVAFDEYAFLQEEVDFVRGFAVNVFDQLTNEPATGLVYTVESFTWFSSIQELGEQLVHLARVRPRPEVVLLATPLPVRQLAGGDPTSPAWSDEYLAALMEAIAAAKLEPGALYLPVAVDQPDEREDELLRKRLRSVCYNALWADTLDLSGGLGSAEEFRRDFDDFWGHPPSEWAAAGAAHALLAQLWIENATPSEWAAAQRVEIDEETFYARVEIDTANGTNRHARVQFAQYRGGESRIIGDDGPVSGLSYRGRWEWVDYSLESSAIVAIVIASILAAAALGLIIWSVFKFVRLFISPPEDEDEDDADDDDDEKKDKKK